MWTQNLQMAIKVMMIIIIIIIIITVLMMMMMGLDSLWSFQGLRSMFFLPEFSTALLKDRTNLMMKGWSCKSSTGCHES
jgi:hypothetical protein